MQPTARSASAAVRSTGTAPAEWHRSHCTSAPRGLGAGGDRRQVEHRAGPEVDVGQGEQRDVVVDGGERVGRVAPAQLEAEQVGDAGGDVAVGGEGVGLDHDHGPLRAQPGGGDDGLEQRYAGASRRRGCRRRSTADQRGDAGRDPTRQPHPVAPATRKGIPRPDQAVSPLVLDHLADPLGDADRQHAERVAVEVDHPRGDPEACAGVGQRRCCVQRLGVGASRRRAHRFTSFSRSRARTTSASNVFWSTSYFSTGVRFTCAT